MSLKSANSEMHAAELLAVLGGEQQPMSGIDSPVPPAPDFALDIRPASPAPSVSGTSMSSWTHASASGHPAPQQRVPQLALPSGGGTTAPYPTTQPKAFVPGNLALAEPANATGYGPAAVERYNIGSGTPRNGGSRASSPGVDLSLMGPESSAAELTRMRNLLHAESFQLREHQKQSEM